MGSATYTEERSADEWESNREEATAVSRMLFVSPKVKWGGPTRSLSLLLDGFTSMHRVGVLVPEDGHLPDVLTAEGISHWRIPWLEGSELRAVYELYRFLRGQQFDLVYANETNSLTRPVCLAATLAGIPFVSHARSMGWTQGWRSLGHLTAAKAVIAVSHACGDSVRRYVRAGCLHVIYNGVPLPVLPEERDAERIRIKRELGLAPSARLILSVGNLSPRKGQRYQLEAMAKVLSEFPDAHLCVAGGGDRHPDYLRHIEKLIRAGPLAGHVTLLGFRSDVVRLMIGADVFLHTALTDPHPRGVLEAMAAALPVVAFATDGVAETVRDAQTGYLVSPKDSAGIGAALRRLLSDAAEARRLGAAGRDRVEKKFSENQVTKKVGRIVEQVLAHNRVGR